MGSKLENEKTGKFETSSEEYWHALEGLNIETKRFEENRQDGLMICGMNWGGKPTAKYNQPTPDIKLASFFSDLERKYTYKNKIVSWFGLLGQPLKSAKSDVCRDSETLGRSGGGQFERSLLQTNWLANQSPDASSIKYPDSYLNGWNDFERRLRALSPRVIIFINVRLLDVLNSETCLPGARALFGKGQKPQIWSGKKGEELPGTEGKKISNRRRIGIQYFDKVTIIALPHPSEQARNEYISAFESEFSRIINKYKKERGFKD